MTVAEKRFLLSAIRGLSYRSECKPTAGKRAYSVTWFVRISDLVKAVRQASPGSMLAEETEFGSLVYSNNLALDYFGRITQKLDGFLGQDLGGLVLSATGAGEQREYAIGETI